MKSVEIRGENTEIFLGDAAEYDNSEGISTKKMRILFKKLQQNQTGKDQK